MEVASYISMEDAEETTVLIADLEKIILVIFVKIFWD
jgi:hypothetical protein